MNTIINQRLALLRSVMAEKQLSAYYIPTADYHLSEYVGEHFKFRAWLSGFTGSAGTLVVLPDEAGLWTDGRYFLQAEQQLKGTGITLYKMQMPGVPSVEEFLTSRLSAGSCVGFDGRTLSASAGEELAETLAKNKSAWMLLLTWHPLSGKIGRLCPKKKSGFMKKLMRGSPSPPSCRLFARNGEKRRRHPYHMRTG